MILFVKLFWIVTLLGLSAPSLRAQTRDVVTVYAAASLKDALDTLLKVRQAQGRGHFTAVYAASSTLARQIERGAPADVFISADVDWMDYLAQRKLLRSGSHLNLLTNQLALITPAHSKSSLTIASRFPLAAALGNDRLAIADPDSVPAGKYGKAALQALGVWDAVSVKLAPTENVRAALLLVARGEVPFGIVYASDATVEPRVRVQGIFPAQTHTPIVFPAAVIATSRSASAEALLDGLRSADARVIWRKFGFGFPD